MKNDGQVRPYKKSRPRGISASQETNLIHANHDHPFELIGNFSNSLVICMLELFRIIYSETTAEQASGMVRLGR